MPAHLPWGEDELKALASQSESRVFRDQRKIPVVLQPFHLQDLKSAVRDLLNASVNSHDKSLDGILMSYKHLKILSKSASVTAETSGVVLEIQADFYVFRPEIGCILKGVVNKIHKDHVGVLVYHRFNVSCPRPSSEARSEKWLGNNVVMHQEVTFKLRDQNFSGRLPFFKGKLISIGEVLDRRLEETDQQTKKKKKKEVIQTLNIEETEDAVSSSVSKKHKHKLEESKLNDTSESKRSKKKRHSSSAEAANLPPETISSNPAPADSSISKKMKMSVGFTDEEFNTKSVLENSSVSKKKKEKVSEWAGYVPRLSLDVSQLPEHLPPPNADSTHFDLAKHFSNLHGQSEKKKSKENHAGLSLIKEESSGTMKGLSKLSNQVDTSSKSQQPITEKAKKKKDKKSKNEFECNNVNQDSIDQRMDDPKISDKKKQQEPSTAHSVSRVDQSFKTNEAASLKKKHKVHDSFIQGQVSSQEKEVIASSNKSVSKEFEDLPKKKKKKGLEPQAKMEEVIPTKEKKSKKNKGSDVLSPSMLNTKEIQPRESERISSSPSKGPSAELPKNTTSKSKKVSKQVPDLFSPSKQKRKGKEILNKYGTDDGESDDTIPPGQKVAKGTSEKTTATPSKNISSASLSFGKSPGISFIVPSSSIVDFDLGNRKRAREVPIWFGNLEGKKIPPPESPMKSPEKIIKRDIDSSVSRPKRVILTSPSRKQSSDSDSDYGNGQTTSVSTWTKLNHAPKHLEESSGSDSDTAVKSRLLQSMGVMQSPLKTTMQSMKHNTSDSESEGSVDGRGKPNILSKPDSILPVSSNNELKLSSKSKKSNATRVTKSPLKKLTTQGKLPVAQETHTSQGAKSISSPMKGTPAAHAADSDSDSDLEIMKTALLQLEQERLFGPPPKSRTNIQKQTKGKIDKGKGSAQKTPASPRKMSVAKPNEKREHDLALQNVTPPRNISGISHDSDSGPDDRNTTALMEEMRQKRAAEEKVKESKGRAKQPKVPTMSKIAGNNTPKKVKGQVQPGRGKTVDLKKGKSEKLNDIKQSASKEQSNEKKQKPKGRKKASADDEISDVMQRLIREAKLNVGLA